MKHSVLAIPILFMMLNTHAQVYDPVSWSFGYEKKEAGNYELIFKANIRKGWHIYSIDVPKGGPIATSFRFDTAGKYSLTGKAFEATIPEDKFDEAFGFKIKSFSDSAQFRQRITSRSVSFTASGTLTYGACNNSICTPPQDIDFSIGIKESPGKISTSGSLAAGSIDSGIIRFFFGAFILGLLGVLTPCVYPMIPMTVAFFARGAEKRTGTILNAIIFGLSIVVIYTSPGIIISLTGAGAGFANTLSTHWIPNLIFFLLFIIFAVSFLGAFEIILPGKWASSADSRVDRGGIFASFFLALTTVIVSFSCTGPIVGSLLVEATHGDILRPAIGMFAFGFAFALPFTLFALFPAILQKLPKSGGWLNSIKVVLGFLMLAFSMKFLMTIDSVYNLRIISRDIYLAVWIVIFSLLGLYLMGRIKFPHDSDLRHIGIFRLFLIITVFSFVVYLVPGLFGAPLNGLSALLPPAGTSKFSLQRIFSESGQAPAIPSVGIPKSGQDCAVAKYHDIFEMPLGLSGYFDYRQGLDCAKELHKPVLLDFKGHACANCKLMEAKVWSDPSVFEILKNNFVIVSLYCDDRTRLPGSEWITSTVDGKIKKTIGKINEDLEISKFKTNALPLYVICDPDGNPLNKPMPTNLNIKEYRKWLDEGLEIFKSK